ncbi:MULTISPECIES: dihydrolipoamide acetyltransferase family protein [Chryseobacterium]|uniref:Dihydrolipoamide acetyltransferase component of pyruvate dehydrogenase complex n=1 Tax=Chryseobacterium camelliae TaxID=1265445 RepID=A0ABU0TH43_9FLAO|nr:MULTISPECIES: dihydrolipoamide acetyltransferase family protein [Chryseobacterium]MDT3405823.1 2-oxoglutarate dehydrogenase E2 component (dihydrolipoamide succinyltransferase) [Pseudacidovorax intermedius]MDQ1096371.1 2-oxoglutarate dehydrogenase E2 component (dihydrolipoamide succinyltransferase) [Chryseobacterium camelliae]MDQ1100310.1 2-oxoglutarate dehydrogenase E2 component (dihydrolipoamide succinyltransferase) [Chryseobacterium sp. SORGH_AS_1048]MDR6087653.1 2-oxoglutarate dehydrogena
MAEYKLLLPSMGEGVMEATIITWLFNEGDSVKEDDSVVEIATDKVDSDVPTPVSGKIVKILKQKDEVAKVGEAIAILEIEGEGGTSVSEEPAAESAAHQDTPDTETIKAIEQPLQATSGQKTEFSGDLYLSPLVKSIAQQENISESELKSIQGNGLEGRITKEDILAYVANRGTQSQQAAPVQTAPATPQHAVVSAPASTVTAAAGDEIIPMDRMRKLIAENMVKAKQIAPHVTSFIETDVTNVVKWRNKNKAPFEKREGEKLTFMPIFVRAVVKAIQDFPMINVSVNGENIIKKKNINIGMATALPDGNLIVPVIKNADQLSLSGLAKAINDLAYRARNKKLRPEDTQGATYTISNVGSFGNLMGTPIIPQPQVAILAIGAIVKKPAVLETPDGDVIAIRNLMFMSHSYDHRVVDGSLGGMMLKHVHDYLENWDLNTEI